MSARIGPYSLSKTSSANLRRLARYVGEKTEDVGDLVLIDRLVRLLAPEDDRWPPMLTERNW